MAHAARDRKGGTRLLRGSGGLSRAREIMAAEQQKVVTGFKARAGAKAKGRAKITAKTEGLTAKATLVIGEKRLRARAQ